MIQGAKHLVIRAIEFIAMEGLHTATIGQVRFCDHFDATRLARIAFRQRIEDREKRFASSIKLLAAVEIDYRLVRATSRMLRGGFSLPAE